VGAILSPCLLLLYRSISEKSMKSIRNLKTIRKFLFYGCLVCNCLTTFASTSFKKIFSAIGLIFAVPLLAIILLELRTEGDKDERK
jgi:hypothetical protein